MRWRWIFVVLPVTGLIIGLVLLYRRDYAPWVSGVVEYLTPPGLSGLLLEEAEPILRSDAIISKIVVDLNLSEKWQMTPEDCIAQIRRKIRVRPIPGTQLEEIRVGGRTRSEAILIWESLVDQMTQHLSAIRDLKYAARRDVMMTQYEVSEAKLEEAERELAFFLSKENRPDIQLNETTEAELRSQLAARANASIVAWRMIYAGSGDCIRFHELPHMAPPFTRWESIQPVFLHLGWWTGMVVSIFLAYLLELLVPRKASASRSTEVVSRCAIHR